MGIAYGLLSALLWGLGDYLVSQLTRKLGTRRALLFVQVSSLLFWIAILAAHPELPAANGGLLGLALIMGLGHVLGLALVYRAFEVGQLSLVSPISSSFGVVTALLALATGERPPFTALAGALLLFVGIVLATRAAQSKGSNASSIAGIPEALGSALGFGIMFWIFYFYVQPELGYLWPLVLLKTMATVGAALFQHRQSHGSDGRAKVSVTPSIWVLTAGAAAADTFAWLAYIRGTATTFATIATALASLFSVVTILLAWIFLRERLSAPQWVGVITILLGVLLVSF